MQPLLDITVGALVWYAGLLDSVPDGIRALVAGGLLAAFLRLAQSRIPANDVQFSISFTKIALIALLVVPVLLWWLPATRVVVLVEALEPATPALAYAWLMPLGVWGAGILLSAGRLLGGYRRARSAIAALPAVPSEDKLAARLTHWQRRLGERRELTLALTSGRRPRHLPGVRRVVLPRAAEHWPAASQDLLIIQELCRIRKNQGLWHLFAQLVACCYWPLPWVRTLDARLLDDFEVATDNLAEACYMDGVGYRRALRQIEQRLQVPGRGDVARAQARPAVALARWFRWYRRHLAALWTVQPCLTRDVETLVRVHDRRRGALWAEPGEKLALLVGQAVVVAMLVGGATLREAPPKVERDFTVMLEDSWMQTVYRDQERAQRQVHLGRETLPDGS